MRRLSPYVLVPCFAFLSLLILATLSLRVLIPQQVRMHLHREIQFDGMSWRLRHVTITNLRLSQSPDFSRGTSLFVESVRVSWSWQPSWRRPLLIREIILDRPKGILSGQVDHIRFLLNEFTATTLQGRLFLNQQPDPYEITGHYRLDKAIMTVDAFQIDQRRQRLTGKGVLELATGHLEADVRFNTDIRATGPLRNPRIRIKSLKLFN